MVRILQFREQLNSCIRDNNVRLESAEQQHQEHIRVIQKLVKDVQSCIKNSKAKQSGTGKRSFASILAEDVPDYKPVVFRSSRTAAVAASAKIRTIAEAMESSGDVKRRCIVKMERISVPTLDVISEEDIIDSPEVPLCIKTGSNLVNEAVISQPSQLPVQKENVKEKHSNEVTESPSSVLEKSLSSDIPANSTFVVDAKSEALKHELPDVSNLVNNNNKNENNSLVQNPGSNKVVEGRDSDVPLKRVLSEEMRKIAKEGSSQKSQKGSVQHQNEENYINLQKLITESPVRVTRTKTRALAKAAAAAAASTEPSESAPKIIINSIEANSMDSLKLVKKKTKIDNKKEVSGHTEPIISPVFKKPAYKISPEDNMKENYINTTEKSLKSATKDLNGASRMKTPLSSNNSLSCGTLQSSKLNIMGTGTIISHCETFIQKNSAKTIMAQQNQKLQEEKVIEAEKKRERLLKDKAEQQKRLNEARAAKVAKAREKLERQRALQQQQLEREKEQRLKIAQQKREEEVAIKRQIAHQRAVEAEERRKQEEEQYLTALKKKEREKEEAEKAAEKKAVQLKKEAEEQLKVKEAEKLKEEKKVKPIAGDSKNIAQSSDMFNTDDIYSGENSEEEEKKGKKIYPAWTSANRVQLQLQYQDMCTLLLHKFFQSERHTPDLRKIFGTVPDRALVRTSSAVWHTPPCNRSFK